MNKKILLHPIMYLEDIDFNSDGSYKEDGVVIILIAANYCPACTEFKPVFQDVANHIEGIKFRTIETDSERPLDKKLVQRLNSIVGPIEGVPMTVVYFQGQMVDKRVGGMSAKEMLDWIQNLK